MSDQDAPTSILSRSMKRFAEKIGINDDPAKEAPVAAPVAPQTPNQKTAAAVVPPPANTPVKTAAEGAENDMKGSQVQTAEDKGDYSPNSAEVSKQNKETRQSGSEGTEQGGSQNQTMDTDDKNYTLSGGGGDARLAMRAIEAVQATATRAMEMVASAIQPGAKVPALPKKAEGAPGVSAGGPAASEMGTEAGGVPPSVQAGEDAMGGGAAAPPAAPADPSTDVGAGDVVLTKVKEKVNDLATTIETNKQVHDILKDTLNEALGAPGDADVTAAKKTAADRKDEGGKSKKDEMGNKKVPHSAADPDDHPQADGDPDWTLYDQSVEGSTEKTSTDSHNGQSFAESSDRYYKLSRKAAIGLHNTAIKIAQSIGTKTASKDLNDTFRKQAKEFAEALKQPQKLPTDAAKMAATILAWSAKPEFTAEDKGRLINIAKFLKEKFAESQPSPDEVKTKGGDDTTRYDSAQKGDTGDDEISKGTDTTKESPETSDIKNDARGTLDKKHNEDTRGSTTASIWGKEQARIVAEIKQVDAAFEALGKVSERAKTAMAHPHAKAALDKVVMSARQDLKKVGDEMQKTFQSTAKTEDEAKKLRTRMAELVKAARKSVFSARGVAMITGAAALEAEAAREKFARVSPAFKLAAVQVRANMIGLEDLPVKVGEYVRMAPNEFAAVEKTLGEVVQKQASIQRAAGGQRGATRLPGIRSETVMTGGEKDELEGLFSDD